MMQKKSGQIAMEYLMVVALVSIVIIPTTVLFYNYASDSAEQIDRAQIDKFGRELVATAETVYYLGYPSRIVLEEKLPSGVESVSVAQDTSTGTYLLLVDVRTKNGVANFSYPTDVNIAGFFGENGTSEGIKRIRIEAAPVIGSSSLVTLNVGENTTCNDDTVHEACSTEKPKYCYNSVLIDNCQECGCTGAIVCKSDGTCYVPKISSVSPSAGSINGGEAVTISGINFIDDPALDVKFGGISASITSASTTQIDVITPVHSAGSVDVVVTNSDGGSGTLSNGFTYVPPPVVSAITPSNGLTSGGTLVNITGDNFKGTPSVKFGGAAASVAFANTTHISVTTPAHAEGAVDVTVQNPDGGTGMLTSGFTYNLPPPSIDLAAPPSGPTKGGTAVTITGTDFVDTPTVDLGGSVATVTFVSSTELSATTSFHMPGAVDVTVTNPDTQADTMASGYTYTLSNPVVSGVNPQYGPLAGGTPITISGTDFFDGPGLAVTVGGSTASSVTFVNSNTITATTPPGAAGPADVVVTNPDSQTATGTGMFEYLLPPSLTSASPTSGRADTTTAVALSGSEFVSGLTVKVNGNTASVTSVTSTQIDAVFPAGTPGPAIVTVINPDGQSDSLLPDVQTGTTPTVTGSCSTAGCSIDLQFNNFIPSGCVLNTATAEPSIAGDLQSSNEYAYFFADTQYIPASGICCDWDGSLSDGDGTDDYCSFTCPPFYSKHSCTSYSGPVDVSSNARDNALTFTCQASAAVNEPVSGCTGYLDCSAKLNWNVNCSSANGFAYVPVSRVFVTSPIYKGKLEGLSGADSKCQQRANAANLGGTWKAWLSTNTVNAKDRIPDRYYVRTGDAAVIAQNKADLLDSSLQNTINRNEYGSSTFASAVWTGTKADGTYQSGYNCNGWASDTSSYYARYGSGGYTSSYWTYYSWQYCQNYGQLYCFEVS